MPFIFHSNDQYCTHISSEAYQRREVRDPGERALDIGTERIIRGTYQRHLELEEEEAKMIFMELLALYSVYTIYQDTKFIHDLEMIRGSYDEERTQTSWRAGSQKDRNLRRAFIFNAETGKISFFSTSPGKRSKKAKEMMRLLRCPSQKADRVTKQHPSAFACV